MRHPILLVVSSLVLALPALAKVQTRSFDYKHGELVLQGFYAYDDANVAPRPGVLVVHEWWGHNQHARNQAMRLARAGYAALALDMFGKGHLATHPKDAQSMVAEVMKSPQLEEARFNAGLAALKAQPQVDGAKLAAIGYCFGGKVCLDMARNGANLVAIGTFHAALAASAPAQKGKVKARLLVQTGGSDPMVPKEQVNKLQDEMHAAGADLSVVYYPGAKHSFTNPDADKAGVEGLAYNAAADHKSWTKLLEFLKKSFGR